MANLNAESSLDEMAAVVSLSKFHFSRVFKNIFGMAPYKYIFLARMHLLEQLLAETDEPLYLPTIRFRSDSSGPHRPARCAVLRRFQAISPEQAEHDYVATCFLYTELIAAGA